MSDVTPLRRPQAGATRVPPASVAVALIVLSALCVPLGLRFANRLLPSSRLASSYLPSIESPRDRRPFDQEVAQALKDSRPEYVVIGDSMAGTRINPGHLTRLAGGRGVVGLMHPGTGTAYWYLVLKNWIVNAGLRPRAAIFFFRDENLTSPSFRVYPGSLDRVALDREPELDRVLAANMHGSGYRVHLAAQHLYQYDRTRDWLEPRMTDSVVGLVAPPDKREAFLNDMAARLFPLQALRPQVVADMPQAVDQALDFERSLPLSLLPEFVRLTKGTGIRLAFIRVQRRPRRDGPPEQSEALATYVASLAAWLRANGAYFHDDWGDPEQPLRIYRDGDHIWRDYRNFYTELFYRRNRELFQ